MKLRRYGTLIICLSLAACSGGGGGSKTAAVQPENQAPETFSIGGSVTGLTGSLVISNSSTDELTLSSNGGFSFANKLTSQSNYRVTIVSQPLDQQCEITESLGIVADSDITSIQIECLDELRIGGTVIGLDGSIQITLNQVEELTLSSDGEFTFETIFTHQQDYTVEISAQPINQHCVLTGTTGTIKDQDVRSITIDCVKLFSISGTITPAARIQVDSDVNDLLAPYATNDSFDTAQQLTNFVTVNGFASAVGTELHGDRFESSFDEFDVYSIHLQANQTIHLQVVDFAGVDFFQGDLDLFLHDADQNLIDSSLSFHEFERLVVPAEGDYFIVVGAFTGISKYVLRFPPGFNQSQPATTGSNFVAGEAIVKFLDGADFSSLTADRSLLSEPVKLNHRDPNRTNLARFRIGTAIINPKALTANSFRNNLAISNPAAFEKFRTLEMIKKLNSRSDVSYAEPNYVRKKSRVPNDPNYELQWHYPAINLPQAWEITTGSAPTGSVIVAVVDTGIYLQHPDLRGQLIDGYDFISNALTSNDGDGIDPDPDDPGDGAHLSSSSWHGTHVAGTIAASSNDGNGAAGVSWGARIMPIRVLGLNDGTSFDIIQGIRFAAGLPNDSGTLPEKKADIINLSLGGNGSSSAEAEEFAAVREAGVFIVAAAGNQASSDPFYPASYSGVISVSATNFNQNRAPYSNFGSSIDIAAPGGDLRFDANQDGYPDGVLSTLVDDRSGVREPALAFYEGTSMASPHVAGVIALMKAVNPNLSSDEFDTLLRAGQLTFDSPQPGRNSSLGFGVVDAFKSVQAAQQLAEGGVLPEIPAVITSAPSAILIESNQTSQAFILANEGTKSASIESVFTDAPWLGIEASQTDSNGLGSYTITVDRTGLTDILYTARITVRSSSGSETLIPVSMLVSNSDSHGNSSVMYVVLLDENQNVVLDTITTQIASGQFRFELEDVPPGNYFLAGGSDIDNDFFLCQHGETCGGFPVLAEFDVISVADSDLSGLDFVIEILFRVEAETLNTGASLSSAQLYPQGIELTRLKRLKR